MSGTVHDTMKLVAAERHCDLSSPVLMGILNVTPDSFSDGGEHASFERALARAHTMIDEGARIIDIGGESTRPGAEPIDADGECARVLPVIEALREQSDVFISIDTVKPQVMRAACRAGADMVNDVNGLRAPGAVEAVADTGAAACIMHMQGEPRTMQRAPHYDDVVAEIGAFLDARIAACARAGIGRERLCIDPGFGFGKTLDHNMTLLRELDALAGAGVALMVGVSRKSMFAWLCPHDARRSRVNASLGAALWAATHGARIIRTHDVADTRDVLCLVAPLTARAPTDCR